MAFKEYIQLSENPIFVRYVRSSLRRDGLFTPMIIVFTICVLIVFWEYQVQPPPGSGYHFIFVLQSIILFLMGSYKVSTTIAKIRESTILDFHRVTPLPAKVQAIGFILGIPIRDYLLYLVTLPFAWYFATQSKVFTLSVVMELSILQLTTAIFSHTLSFLIGLSTNKAKNSGPRTIGLMIGISYLNSMSNGLFLGFNFYSTLFISPFNLYIYHLRTGNFQGAVQPPPPAVFFGFDAPIFWQTIFTQIILGSFIFLALSRRLHSEKVALLSKPQALALLFTSLVLTIGILWPYPKVIFLGIYSYLFTVLAMIIGTVVTTNQGDYIRGCQRARKFGSNRLGVFNSLNVNVVLLLLFSLLLLTGFLVGVFLVSDQGMGNNPQMGRQSTLFTGNLLVGSMIPILTLLSFGWGLQYFHLAMKRRVRSVITLWIFLWWILPLAIGSILSMGGNFNKNADVLPFMLPSPFVSLGYAFGIGLEQNLKVDQLFVVFTPIVIMSSIFLALTLREIKIIRQQLDKSLNEDKEAAPLILEIEEENEE